MLRGKHHYQENVWVVSVPPSKQIPAISILLNTSSVVRSLICNHHILYKNNEIAARQNVTLKVTLGCIKINDTS